jgi:hypothetical protein
VPLGLLSEERVGWFIIALLPLLLALALMARDEQRARNAAIGAAIAGGGCTAFGLVLLLTVEHPRAVAAEVPALLAASGVAAMLAGFGVFALWQWRARTHGLFA